MKISETGNSLVEVLLVVAALGVIVALMSNLPNAMSLISKAKHLGLAREIANKQIEDRRQTLYSNLSYGTVNISDPRISLLPGGSGSVLTEDCPDEICPDPDPGNREHIKQITVTISWTENAKPQQTVLKTFIGEGGLNQPDE